MSTTMIPPFGRGVLATGKRVGRHFHAHVLGVAIIREQLHDGDVMIEAGTGERVVRMRTEIQERVPALNPRTIPLPRIPRDNERPTDVIPVVWPDLDEPSTARIIFGIPFRRDLPPAR